MSFLVALGGAGARLVLRVGRAGRGWGRRLEDVVITMLTYFHQACVMTPEPGRFELTFGLGRIVMFLQGVREVWQIDWYGTRTDGDIYPQQEIDH